MASLENNEQGSSPRKRQKLDSSLATPISSTSSSRLNIATSSNPIANSSDKMEIDPPGQSLVSDVPLSSRPEHAQEVRSGILHYVNKKNPGFQGILKQRYVYLSFLPPIWCGVCHCGSRWLLLQFCLLPALSQNYGVYLSESVGDVQLL